MVKLNRISILKNLGRFGVALLALLLSVPALQAQTTAQLSGTVTDPTGAVVPGAQVSLINEANRTHVL